MNLAIIFGGSSYEHEISIVSAITLKKVLKHTKVEFVFVDGARDFYLIDSEDMTSKHFSSGSYKKSKKLSLKKRAFYIDGLLGSKPLQADVILNLIHGRDGEDGKIAAIFDFYSIPYMPEYRGIRS